MRKRKTEEQINEEIVSLVALKPMVRERNTFGDDNHAAIDAQLAVLQRRMSIDDVNRIYGDECTLDHALSAYDWMAGGLADDEDSPAASWVVAID